MSGFYTKLIFDYLDDKELIMFTIGFESESIGIQFIDYYNNLDKTTHKNKIFSINKKYPIKKYFEELVHKSQQPKPIKLIGKNEVNLFGQIISKITYIAINLDTINHKRINSESFIKSPIDDYFLVEDKFIGEADEFEPKLAKIEIVDYKFTDAELNSLSKKKYNFYEWGGGKLIEDDEYDNLMNISGKYDEKLFEEIEKKNVGEYIHAFISPIEYVLLSHKYKYKFELENTYRKKTPFDIANGMIDKLKEILYNNLFEFTSNSYVNEFVSQDVLKKIESELTQLENQGIIEKNKIYIGHTIRELSNIYNKYLYPVYSEYLFKLLDEEKEKEKLNNQLI